MKKYDLHYISESRDVLFGISTLLIAFFHSLLLSTFFLKINGPVGIALSTCFDIVKNFGNIGVDVFLFLSGIGLYFSFSKNNDIKQFYKKRMLRIIPESIIVTIIFNVVWFRSVLDFILSISFTEIYITGYKRFWFISLMIVLYLAYPFIYKFYENKGVKALVILIITVVAFNLVMELLAESYYNKIEIVTTRIPIFLIGAFLAKYVKNHKTIPLWSVAVSAVIFLLSTAYIFFYRVSWVKFSLTGCRYLYIVVSLTLIILISYFDNRLSIKWIKRFLIWIGGYSIEIYLIFEIISSEFAAYSKALDEYCFFYTIITFSISLVLSILLKKGAGIIIKRFN